MLRTAPAVVSASRKGSLRQVQTLLGSSPNKATTGAAKLGIWMVHATTSAVIVPRPMNTDRRQRPGVGASSAHNDSIIGGVGSTSRAAAGTTLTSERPPRSARCSSRRRGTRKTADGDDGRCAHPERMFVIPLLEANANLEAVGEAHPVQRAPHVGQHADGLPVSRPVRPADSLHDAAKWSARGADEVNVR